MYGFTRAALREVVGAIGASVGAATDEAGASKHRRSCLEHAYAAMWAHREDRDPRAASGSYRVFEDELVGVCAHLLRLPLVACGCFARDSPCDGGRPTFNGERFDSRKCRDGTPQARLCRLPLGAHRVKDPQQYDAWWRFLERREAAQEALLDV